MAFKMSKIIVILSLLHLSFLTVTIRSSNAQTVQKIPLETNENDSINNGFPSETGIPSSFGRADRFFAGTMRATMTCDKYPRVCSVTGSPGPDCCKKKCVNVSADKTNCGKCGKKCKSYELCCHGSCVNPNNNKNHCGRCNNKCSKGDTCVYGLCNYA